MNNFFSRKFKQHIIILTIGLGIAGSTLSAQSSLHHYLYVATPGVRNYLEYGGHGLLVFDIDNNFKFIKKNSNKGIG